MADDPFEGLLNPMEKMMGPEAFQMKLQGERLANEAHVASLNAMTDWYTSKANSLRVLCLLAVLTMLPVLVWLWKWAL